MPGSRILGRYRGSDGRGREVLARPGLAGSVLVIDCDALTRGDGRLVAHLFPDEPAMNAALVCEQYLKDSSGPRCRPLTPGDLGVVPCEELEPGVMAHARGAIESADLGVSHRLELIEGDLAVPALRWRRYRFSGSAEGVTVSVREVIGLLESYEPVRELTAAALVRHGGDPRVSVAVLRAELDRVHSSPIVLNRGLRLAVLAAIRVQGLSMSEIATRCGRVKTDLRGNQSGETSWLSRRLGIASEGGDRAPSPWVHSEVLALIARRGLGIGPHEVELG